MILGMSTYRGTQLDPHLVAGLSGQFASLGDQLRRLSGDLGALHAQLVAQPVQAPRQPLPQPGRPRWDTGPQPMPPHSRPRAEPVVTPPARRVEVRAPRVEKTPWWQRDGVISRVLAVAGAGVTLVGVVMLLILAAQAGWFGPELRVGVGAVFSIALVYIGSRVFGKPGGRVGGIAVAATGIAGLYLDVVAMTVIYEWLETSIGLVAAFGIAAAGVALAVSWRSQAMAVLILTGVALCAPVLTGGITPALVCFFAATFVASFAAQLGRDWPILGAVRTVPIVVVSLIAIAQAGLGDISDIDALILLIVSAVVAAFGLGSSAALLRRNNADTMATATIGFAALPILAAGTMFGTWTASIIESTVALVAVITLVALRWLPRNARVVLTTIGSLALLQAVLLPTAVDYRPLALLVVAAVLVVAAQRSRSRLAYFTSAAFAALGTVGFLLVSPPASVVDSAHAAGGYGVVLAGFLLVALAVGMVRVAAELEIADANLGACWIIAGLVAIYASTAATVALGIAALGGETGFVAGHCAATIAWMAAAMALLALGLRSEKYAHIALMAGLSLTAASVAKLFLFDLGALDGMFRVGAFIVVGLLLLLAGTRYARRFAHVTEASSPV